jgi:lipopolysaccharide transport protein LptA
MRRRSTIITLSCLVLGVGISPAAAQLSAAKGPLDIRSDEGSARMSNCSLEYRGNVEALQGDGRLRADEMIRFSAVIPPAPGKHNGGCGDVVRMEAHGHVFYVTPTRRVRGDDAVYKSDDATLTILGDVVLVQGQDVQRSGRVVVNTRTNEASFQSRPAAGEDGRVRAVIYPPSTRQD